VLTEDDGETTAYTQGRYRIVTFSWNDNAQVLSWTLDDHSSGPGDRMFHEVFLTVIDSDGWRSSKKYPLNAGGRIPASATQQWQLVV